MVEMMMSRHKPLPKLCFNCEHYNSCTQGCMKSGERTSIELTCSDWNKKGGECGHEEKSIV